MKLCFVPLALIAFPLVLQAQDTPSVSSDAPSVAPADGYSPYPAQDFPNQVFFGDTHLHTSYSWDAGMVGNTLGPEDAYNFAKGAAVTSSTGVPARLQRPLDFLVVSDHSDGLGIAPLLARSDETLLADPLGAELYALTSLGTIEGATEAYNVWLGRSIDGTNHLASDQNVPKAPWEEIVDAAEAANTPGSFTAFIGYEWSSAPNGNNLHRVVVYRDGKEEANTRIPLSSDLNEDPEALWDWMEQYQAETGGQLLAIPHNGNLSNGLMFDDTRFNGEPLTAEYAERRQRLEPLYEVTQMKGDAETHPMLSPDDAFADFETWDKGSFGTEAKTPDMLPREYARAAYLRGLHYDADLGANPFKFGMIGSTDAHTALSTSQENNFFGKITALEPTANAIRFEEPITGRLSGDEERMIRAWDAHFVSGSVPEILPGLIRHLGHEVVDVIPVPLTAHFLKPDGLAITMLHLMRAYAVSNDLVETHVVQDWFDEQIALDQEGRFFFSMTQFVVVARRSE